MRLLQLHLENYINIYHGLGRTSLDIDFSSDEKYEEFLSLLKNRSEYQFEVDLNNFNEAQKLCKDAVIFIKDEEAEKITKILMSIL